MAKGLEQSGQVVLPRRVLAWRHVEPMMWLQDGRRTASQLEDELVIHLIRAVIKTYGVSVGSAVLLFRP
jgi:hypothetical protein